MAHDSGTTPSSWPPARHRARCRSTGSTCLASTCFVVWTTRTSSRTQLRAGGRRLVIIGSGWIGMEVGATARDLGTTSRCSSAIRCRSPQPWAPMGEVFRTLHLEHGVDLRTSVERRADRRHRPRGRRGRGRRDHFRRLCSSAWGRCRTPGSARPSGLDIGNGILTDSALGRAPRRLRGRRRRECVPPGDPRHLRSDTGRTRVMRGRWPPARCSACRHPHRSSVLLHRPVRSEHGAFRVCAADDGCRHRGARRPRREDVHRLLAGEDESSRA